MSYKVIVAVALICLAGCRGQQTKPAPAAVAVEKPKSEAELAYTTLSAKAARSLGIRTQPASIDQVQEHLVLPGWITAAPGQEVIVTAPAAGYVRWSPALNHVPAIGETVAANQELFRLDVVLSPAEQIQIAALKRGVESELTKAKISLKLAQTEWERLKNLVEQKLRGQQELDQAHKNLDHAREELAAAKDKQALFALAAMPIRAPRAGKVLAVQVSPGQYVAAAAPLLTILDLRPAWLRVAVPEFDLPLVQAGQPVLVLAKKMPAQEKEPVVFDLVPARPVGRSPFVEPGKHSLDLLFELDPWSRGTGVREAVRALGDPPLHGFPAGLGLLWRPLALEHAWSKDQLLNVHVPLNRRQRETVVPTSAVVMDIHGSAWIYLDRTPAKASGHRYLRRRVELGAAVPGGTVIRPSLALDDRVVTHGAAALFSREFHYPPGASQAVDDDD